MTNGTSQTTSPDVVVVGGGVIGLATAWKTAKRGVAVTVVDPAPGTGATWAAAGMLAPVTEAHYGEEDLLRLDLAAARDWPAFARELEEDTGVEVGYRDCGTLAVAADGGDRAVLEELYRYQRSLGLEAAWVTSRQAREREPLVAPGIRGGLVALGDHQVHNRRLVEALRVATARAGVDHVTARVAEVSVVGDRATGVVLAGGERLAAPTVVLAAGCWSAGIAGLPPEAVPPVRPVKGQILRLRGPAQPPMLHGNVRGMVSGTSFYLVPRADGTVVLGATVEEQGFDTTVRAGSVATLLRDARAVVPAVDELELVEALAGLRPGSPDNAPLLGPSVLPGLVVATGHYRNGILLTPTTAEAMAHLLVEGSLPDLVAPFSPRRWEAGGGGPAGEGGATRTPAGGATAGPPVGAGAPVPGVTGSDEYDGGRL
ncbi:MAG TPA: glycine oxidase ThiO [Acidimicrobiales bacterium]|jgi:glycine oxidase|nr:glycine oxidase ThiO [Acidimicrobiales bacterium]